MFRGDKALTAEQVRKQLGIQTSNDPMGRGENGAFGRFLVPVSECEFALSSILDDLQSDPWPVQPFHRPARCVGAALNVAVGILENLGSQAATRGSRIVTIMGGAITYGPGMIVSENMKELIRSHVDLQNSNDNTKHLKPAIEFFQGLADRAQKSGIVIDTFVASVDQVGVLELKPCLE